MSTELLLVLTVIFLGILGAIVILAFDRWIDQREHALETDESEFMIAPYGELRKRLAELTPLEVPRKELAMTPADIVELADRLDAEVNNGGFDQFLFNSSGDYAIETIEALTHIGAIATADLVRIACKRFPRGSPPADIATRRTLMLESVSPDADTFEDLDRRFYEYDEPLLDLIDEYKEKHSL